MIPEHPQNNCNIVTFLEIADEPEKDPAIETKKKSLPALSVAQMLLQRRQKLAVKKRRIALLSSSIMENPEEQVRTELWNNWTSNLSVVILKSMTNIIVWYPLFFLQTRKLRELRLMLEETDPELCVTVRKLVMVSLMEVFKDIIPDYRVRVATDKEKQQSVRSDFWDASMVRDCNNNFLHMNPTCALKVTDCKI